jgi:hypothetical protein
MSTNPNAEPARTACSPVLAAAIERLRALLVAEFGEYHAFVVSGAGEVLGAASTRYGVVVARTSEARAPGYLEPTY